ncbi:MAG: alpha-L-fucosidase [Anaerolineae bacterium]|nr:alpha-L-fucosidase [Anaerolineae bacterium]
MDPFLPAPFGAVPSPRQMAWHQLETYGFIHFTTNTFTDLEWGYGNESPAVFNPTTLDARQWVDTAKQGGFKGLILTCKHHDGFCLWPSRYTEHSVKNSPWRSGRGDVVRELADACREGGLQFGVYLSPWDRNHARYGDMAYVNYYRDQLRELLTHYGPVFEVWHDGANGGNGWYGGADETRKINPATYYGWETTRSIVRQLQPEAVIFSDAGPDVRWVGNESGVGAETTWCTFNPAGRYAGSPAVDDLGSGHENGSHWIPPETDVSIRPGWFYHAHEDGKVKTPEQLVEIYFQSVGRGTSLLLNLPPDRRGLIHENDVASLCGYRTMLDRIFATDLAKTARISATHTRNPETAPGNLVQDDPELCWAAPDGILNANITLDFPTPITFNIVQLKETIALGQRVRAWRLEIVNDQGIWEVAAAGTTIGYKRLVRFVPHTTRKVRLVLADCKACPVLTSIQLFYSPEAGGNGATKGEY